MMFREGGFYFLVSIDFYSDYHYNTITFHHLAWGLRCETCQAFGSALSAASLEEP